MKIANNSHTYFKLGCATLCLLSFLIVPPQAYATSDERTASIEHVKFYTRSNTSGFQAYQSDLLDLVLQKSQPIFGDFTVEYYDYEVSFARLMMLMQDGSQVNMAFATDVQGTNNNQDKIIRIDFPVVKGLLGLRELIIKPQQEKYLTEITSIEDLKSLRAGLVELWPDTAILRDNQLDVIGTDSLSHLFKMLAHNRFDYIPLSLLETESTLLEYKVTNAELVTSKSTALFYPIPMFIIVSAKEPELAQRIETGLQIAKEDGSFDRLFEIYFSGFVYTIKENNYQTFMLSNKTNSDKQNKQITKAFTDAFGEYLKLESVPESD